LSEQPTVGVPVAEGDGDVVAAGGLVDGDEGEGDDGEGETEVPPPASSEEPESPDVPQPARRSVPAARATTTAW
jgi:hypothetical protein